MKRTHQPQPAPLEQSLVEVKGVHVESAGRMMAESCVPNPTSISASGLTRMAATAAVTAVLDVVISVSIMTEPARTFRIVMF